MKKECVLKNLRSELGYRLSVDVDQNLVNNIRIWCMNNKIEMNYYLAPNYIDAINRDNWPNDLVIHAVYYLDGIKHDFSEKEILRNIIPDLSNIVLGMECNGYIPGDIGKDSTKDMPLLLEDGSSQVSNNREEDVFEKTSGFFFYDEDPDFYVNSEKHHTIEPDGQNNVQHTRNQTSAKNKTQNDKDIRTGYDKTVQKNSVKPEQGQDKADQRAINSNLHISSEEYYRNKRNRKQQKNNSRHLGPIIGTLMVIFVIIAGIIIKQNLSVGNENSSSSTEAKDYSSDTNVKPSKTVDAKEKGDTSSKEIDFSNILSQETNEVLNEIYINDYDANGTEEAFATTINSENSDYNDLWYISDQGATLVSEVGHCPQLLITETGAVLVPWRAGYGATICFGLYHGQVKQLEIYTADIFQEDGGTIFAVEEYFTANGEFHKNIECEFDLDTFELVYTDRYYESYPEEDDSFCWNRETPDFSEDSEETIINENDYETNNSDISFLDSELYKNAIASIPGTIQEWCFEDFDGDGKSEAFLSTGEDSTYYSEDGIKSLWYISDENTIECIIDEEEYWYFSDIPFVFDDCKLFCIDARHGFYSVLGIYNNSPVEVKMPEDTFYYWISQDPETGVVTAAEKREERAHILEYDSSTMSFVDTGKTILND